VSVSHFILNASSKAGPCRRRRCGTRGRQKPGTGTGEYCVFHKKKKGRGIRHGNDNGEIEGKRRDTTDPLAAVTLL